MAIYRGPGGSGDATNDAASEVLLALTAKDAAIAAQTAAESARDATLAAYDSFDDRYLGAKSSAPTLDNDGNALVGGALYFDTVSQGMKVYTGSAWVDAYVPGSTYLAKANNLSDLTNTATARTNLGLAIGTNVQAYDADLTTIAGLTPTNNYAIIGNGTTWTSSALPATGVTSVGGTGTVNGITLTGTVTSTGNLTLGGTLSNVSLSTQVTGTLPISNGGTGQTTANAAFNALVPSQTSNSGKYLTTDGTNTSWVTVSAGGFDAGTRLIFAQTSAPTGWTKDTTNYNNHALRVVTGSASTGGSVDFTTAFASQAVSGTVGTSGATTLSTSQIPSHNHTFTWYQSACAGNPLRAFYDGSGAGSTFTTNSTGGGGSHTHSGGTFTGTDINLAVKYLDVITATKN